MCMCTRTYTYAYTYTCAPKRAELNAKAEAQVFLVLGFLSSRLALACLVRCRAWVNKYAPRWSTRDVYDRDLR